MEPNDPRIQFCGRMCLKASAMGYGCRQEIDDEGHSLFEFRAMDGHIVRGQYKMDPREALESLCQAFAKSTHDTASRTSNS
jgi:hypothetical protein